MLNSSNRGRVIINGINTGGRTVITIDSNIRTKKIKGILVKAIYLFHLVFDNVARFESRYTTPLILLVLSLTKNILLETHRKTVAIFLVSLYTNTTVRRMMILKLRRFKCNTDLMILLEIFFLLEYRISLVNNTLDLFFSLVRSVVLPLLLLLTPLLI